MAQLTADKSRRYESNLDPLFNDLPVKASTTIYEGSAVGAHNADAKRARQLVANDQFLGFADALANNAAGAADAIKVRLRSRGLIQLVVEGVTGNADLGATVYASDGDTFTLTSTGNSPVGKIHRHVSGTTVIVFFEAAAARSI